MTSKFDNTTWTYLNTELTDNEQLAAIALVNSCLDAMGGNRPADLEYDEHTWIDGKDLMAAGWNRHAAAATLGSLITKGFVQEYDKNQLVLTTEAWKYLDTIWDETQAGDKPKGNDLGIVGVTYSKSKGDKFWIVTAVDAEGNQVGEGEFPPNGVEMSKTVWAMVERFGLERSAAKRIK